MQLQPLGSEGTRASAFHAIHITTFLYISPIALARHAVLPCLFLFFLLLAPCTCSPDAGAWLSRLCTQACKPVAALWSF